MAFVEDLTPFFDTDGFGEEFTYFPAIGSPIVAVGIYDNAFYSAQGGEIEVAGSQPQVVYATASIPEAPVYGERLTVKGKDYTIVGIEPDGTGITTLKLEVRDDGSC